MSKRVARPFQGSLWRWGIRATHLASLFGLLGGLATQSGCRHRDDETTTSKAGKGPRPGALGAAVVSTVSGHPITIAEVRALVSASELSPREALLRLQAERLLMLEATRRGMDQRLSVDVIARQSSVQALLKAEAEAVVISESELQRAYADGIARFDRPEARASVHVLAKLPANASKAAEVAAQAFAQSMIAPLAEADDLDALLRSQHGQKTELFEVVAERLPAVDLGASYAPSYLEGLFSVAAHGVVPGPVRTKFGWHAIRVTEIVARKITPFATASEILRGELTAVRREQRIKELVVGLRGQNAVVVSKDVDESLALLPL